MQISTTKTGRKVKLTAAELRVLESARSLCGELSSLLADSDASSATMNLICVIRTYGFKPKEAEPASTAAAEPLPVAEEPTAKAAK